MKSGKFILKVFTCIEIGMATIRPAVAETRPPDFICAGKNDQVPVFLTKDAKGAVERLQATSRENGSVRMSYEQVSSAEIAELCANGVSLATMPKPISSRSNSLNRQKVDVAAYVPSSFSIISS